MIASWQKNYAKPRQFAGNQRHYSANKVPSSQGYGLPSGHVWLWELDHKEGRTSRIDAFVLWCWRRPLKFPQTTRGSNQSILREVNWSWRCWSWSSSILVIWCKQPTHWKSPWCWERLRAKEEAVTGWDGWMALPMQWTWTWANFGRWQGTERPDMLKSMELQRVRQDWVTEQQCYNWTHLF